MNKLKKHSQERIMIRGLYSTRADILDDISFLERNVVKRIDVLKRERAKLKEIEDVQTENKRFFAKELKQNPIKANVLYKSEINRGNRNIRDLKKRVQNAEERVTRARAGLSEGEKQSKKDLEQFVNYFKDNQTIKQFNLLN